MSFVYFAYGSNMLSSRLKARCSSARVIGIAHARHHVLEFTKRSIDGSGKATLTGGAASNETPGVLFEIDADQRIALDKFEGAGNGYDRVEDFKVDTIDGTITATTYLASTIQSDLIPFDWYLALVVAGALEHRLLKAHIHRLSATAYASDQDLTRKSRVAALEALASHGYEDHMTLLKR